MSTRKFWIRYMPTFMIGILYLNSEGQKSLNGEDIHGYSAICS
jgi:hypothetical protein